MALNSTNKAAFLALAKAATDEFSGNDDFTALPEEIKAALQEQIADAKKDAAKIAAREIMTLFGETKQETEKQVDIIRQSRRNEKEALAQLAKINRAKTYALISGNYFPLMALTNPAVKYELRHTEGGDKLIEVPDSWQPAVAETPAQVIHQPV